MHRGPLLERFPPPRRGTAMTDAVRIRAARPVDAPALAPLCGQLGYPADAAAVARRLQDIAAHDAGVVLVAEHDGAICGWAHVDPERSLVLEPRCQLAGLVVDEGHRDAGIGAVLLRAAEAWTVANGFSELAVRSNVVRERAHRFYQREGYVEKKRQAVFAKGLA